MQITSMAAALLAAAASGCAYTLEGVGDVTQRTGADVMTYAEYNAMEHAEPYVLQLEDGSGALLYFGARHTTRPDDPQIDSIRRAWQAFRPTVALVETRRGWRGSLEGGVRQFGESAAAVALARAQGIPVFTLDAPIELEIASVLEQWTREQVTMFYVLRSYTARAPANRSDGQARELLSERGRWPGLDGALTTVAAMDSIWSRDFPDLPDWRGLPWQATWPNRADTWLNRLSADVNRSRDQHMIALITTLVERGERVFAVVGSSHVVMQEEALRNENRKSESDNER
jgi:hypothetical protein